MFGDPAYRSEALEDALAERGALLVVEYADRRGRRQCTAIASSRLERAFRLGETLAKTSVGIATRSLAKVAAYTYASHVNPSWVVRTGG